MSMRFGIGRTAALGLVISAILFGRADAATVQFSATLDGDQETTCAPATAAQGAATATLDDVSGQLSWNITFGNNPPDFDDGALDLGTEILAHFHGPAAPGATAGIKVTLPLGSPKIGNTVVASASDRADLIAGLWYINIHSNTCPGGEIRGQVLRVPSCGDGIVDGPGEECDDGNVAGGDGCDASCQTEPAPPVPAVSPAAAAALVVLLLAASALLLRRRTHGSH